MVLKKGDTGIAVSNLQTDLKALGYNLGKYGPKKDGIDGEYGSMTAARVRDFQREWNKMESKNDKDYFVFFNDFLNLILFKLPG
jgi:hypothetical protein